MAGNEEVRIVAVLDNTDVDSGVQRVENATRRMKQAVESSMNDTGAASGAGADMARQFSNSFIKRLVIRDAIYGMLRGLSAVAGDVAADIAVAFGAAVPKGGFLAGFEKWIGDGIFRFMEQVRPDAAYRNPLLAADTATRERTIAQLQADETQRFRNELYKEDPRTFGKSSATVNDQINILNEQLTEAKINNQRYHEFRSHGGGERGANGMNITDEALALIEEDTKKRLKQADFELAIAKEKERMIASEEKHDESAEAKKERAAAAEEKRAKAKADHDAKHEAAVEKNHKEHEIAAEQLEIHRKGPSSDLEFTKKELAHERATSAVVINGGLYGRNDANAALVQHAAQQVSLLRSIDSEIKELRKERSDLTLL